MDFKAKIMEESDIDRVLLRIAHQICEKNRGIENLCLVGIRTRGVPLAQRLAHYIGRIEGKTPEVGALDISQHRDDISHDSITSASKTDVPFSVEGKTVVLVDDVIYTCRTARAALDAVMALGRPSRIQLSVLIDRGHAELPIRPNFVGKNIPTSREELISVHLRECDGEDFVGIYSKN
ncbi:MAG: bifunctional pyr operon transcriptional regulator/uracil phosphoribosyltransferase PyrR [Ruminococcus sp.]|nr:bifunctional pyr operon transcriptional regulator/uracil phosphoribosyltransferase PyrR [Ruminococcus sp.]